MTYFDDAIDIHHIFPKAWCEARRIKPQVYNSIINKTPLTARTNRVIGGRAPSEYLSRLASGAKADIDTISKHVSTHLADPALMAVDDFETFFAAANAPCSTRSAQPSARGSRTPSPRSPTSHRFSSPTTIPTICDLVIWQTPTSRPMASSDPGNVEDDDHLSGVIGPE
jgi:hypothetical protein